MKLLSRYGRMEMLDIAGDPHGSMASSGWPDTGFPVCYHQILLGGATLNAARVAI